MRLKKDILVFQGCILLEKDWTKLKNLHVFVNLNQFNDPTKKCEMGCEVLNIGDQINGNVRNNIHMLERKH